MKNSTSNNAIDSIIENNNLWLFKRISNQGNKSNIEQETYILATEKGLINIGEISSKVFVNNFRKENGLFTLASEEYRQELNEGLFRLGNYKYDNFEKIIINLNDFNNKDEKLSLTGADLNLNNFNYTELKFEDFIDSLYSFNKVFSPDKNDSKEIYKLKLYDIKEDDKFYYAVGYKENQIILRGNELIDFLKKLINDFNNLNTKLINENKLNKNDHNISKNLKEELFANNDSSIFNNSSLEYFPSIKDKLKNIDNILNFKVKFVLNIKDKKTPLKCKTDIVYFLKELIKTLNSKDYIVIKYDYYEKIKCRRNELMDKIKLEEFLDLSNNLIYLKIAYYLMNTQDPLYNHFQIPKSNGKEFREIYAPNEKLKELMKELLIPLNSAFDSRLMKKESNQNAYIKGRNTKFNTQIHKFNEYVIKFDFHHFFDTCKWEYFEKYLNLPRCIKDDEEFLNNYIKPAFINPETNGLYMGNPVSGVLANMITHPLAYYLKNVVKSNDINFSMYADDLTFSANELSDKFNKTYLTALINNALKMLKIDNITLNTDKTRVLKNNGRRITGIRINHKNELTVGEAKYRELNVMLYHLQNGQEISIPVHTLQARIIYYLYYDESGKMRKLVNKYKPLFEENGLLFLPNNYPIDENDIYNFIEYEEPMSKENYESLLKMVEGYR